MELVWHSTDGTPGTQLVEEESDVSLLTSATRREVRAPREARTRVDAHERHEPRARVAGGDRHVPHVAHERKTAVRQQKTPWRACQIRPRVVAHVKVSHQ